ncbi:MAG: PepSY-associated TM helix domain-containing protein [Desulforhopalus sp.]
MLHRDVGYLCIGLTLVYAISGIAVNHISHSFNPSYSIEKSTDTVTPLPAGNKPDMQYIRLVLEELEVQGTYKNAALVSPETMRIFVEGITLDVEMATGMVTMEKTQRKPLLYEVNYLHLNKAKGSWTWLADAYGAALCLLALTGLLMIRGKQKRRGIILTAMGFLVPAIYLVSAL